MLTTSARWLLVTCLAVLGVAFPASPAAADPGFRLPFESGRQFPITQGPAQHAAGAYPDYNRHAVDFAMPIGTPVLASAAGRIHFEGYDSTGAIQVRIDHGSDRCTQYVHLSRTIINTGQQVGRGQLIGYSGNTGISSGPHLHWNMVFCSTHRSREVVNTLEMGTSYPVGTSARSQNSTGANPRGSFDVVSSPAPGRIRVAGWAFDADQPTAPVDVHVYVGGPAGAPGARGVNLGAAAGSRPDVGRAYPGVGDNHGFDVTIDSRGGSLPVYVYAINRAGTPGENVLLGRRDLTVADPNPTGHVDSITSPQAGEIRLTGWALDPNVPTRPLAYHVYVGGPAGDPAATGYAFGPARASRPDVAAAYPGAGRWHGISWSFPTTRSGAVPVHVYAINEGPGENVLIGAKVVQVTAGVPRIRARQRPIIRGLARPGAVLRAAAPRWTVPGVLVRYQWTRDGRAVRGATRITYVVRRSDGGHRLAVTTVAVRKGYRSGRATSQPVRAASAG